MIRGLPPSSSNKVLWQRFCYCRTLLPVLYMMSIYHVNTIITWSVCVCVCVCVRVFMYGRDRIALGTKYQIYLEKLMIRLNSRRNLQVWVWFHNFRATLKNILHCIEILMFMKSGSLKKLVILNQYCCMNKHHSQSTIASLWCITQSVFIPITILRII